VITVRGISARGRPVSRIAFPVGANLDVSVFANQLALSGQHSCRDVILVANGVEALLYLADEFLV
jgi:hypothetical protein